MCLAGSLLSFGLRIGAVMARRRRPPLTVAPPPELLVFDPDEWPADQWWQSCELWGAARMAFVKAHPGSSLGSALDVLRAKRRLYEAHRRSEWEAGLNGRAS
jgi:hypothetical protein